MFTDPDRGLTDELLVSGADELCELLCKRGHVVPENGFTVHFTPDVIELVDQFTDVSAELTRHLTYLGEANGGYLYRHEGVAVWLCANLLRYCPEPPSRIYYLVEEHAALDRYKRLLPVGTSLVYCRDLSMINDFVIYRWTEETDTICRNSPSIDWINLHVVDTPYT
jgi:hypothetical protein